MATTLAKRTHGSVLCGHLGISTNRTQNVEFGWISNRSHGGTEVHLRMIRASSFYRQFLSEKDCPPAFSLSSRTSIRLYVAVSIREGVPVSDLTQCATSLRISSRTVQHGKLSITLPPPRRHRRAAELCGTCCISARTRSITASSQGSV